MARRVAAVLALLLAASAAHAALPLRADLAAAVGERYEEALDRIPAGPDAGRAQLYFRSVALLETGHTVTALETLRGLAATNEAFAGPALERVAQYAFERGRYKEVTDLSASAAVERLLDVSSFAYRVGQSHFMQARYEEALPWLEMVGEDRFSPYAKYTRALIHFEAGDTSRAIEILGEALEAVTSHPDRELRKVLVDRFRLVRGRMIHHAALSAEDLGEEKRNRLFKVAASQLSLIKTDSPYYAEALRTLGWCSAESGDSVRALAAFETASAVDPENAHEDFWSTGRVMERLGYFDEAAAAYGKARQSARDWAEAWELESSAPVERDPVLWAMGWGALFDLTDKVLTRSSRIMHSVALAGASSKLRAGRLDGVDTELAKRRERVKELGEELVRMDKDLYHYLDVIPARALFPKRDRPRIDAVMDRQERLMRQTQQIEKALQELELTRAWERAAPERRERADALWQRAYKSEVGLSHAQLGFLEGVKFRVSVREKELVRLVDARKQETAALNDPLTDCGNILSEERKKLASLDENYALLAERAEKARTAMADLRRDLEAALREAGKGRITDRAAALRLKADEYALDEAQALHLMEERLNREGGQ